MSREYLRVTPTSANLDPDTISTALSSLHKLSPNNADGLATRLNPIRSAEPLIFEFVAISEGEDEPVEFYYGANARLDVLEQRLRTIYPSSFDIEHVDVDITKQLIRPVEHTRDEFAERLEDGRLYCDLANSDTQRATVSDSGEVAVARESSDAGSGQSEEEIDPGDADGEVDLEGVDLAPPDAFGEDEPRSALDRPTVTSDGHIFARPPLSEVEPYGVEWWGAAERRKDWMTTLTRFTEFHRKEIGLADEVGDHSRLPLTPLLKHLTETDQPKAYQVVFQPRPDWSRDARRRAGELLDGSDTLLQKILGLESQGSRQRSGSRRSSHQSPRRTSRSSPPRGNRSPANGGSSRPTSVEETIRYEDVRSNSLKRTFSVNLRVLTLAVDGDEPDGLSATLDPLRSVFDLVDGEFYEMDGRRFSSHGTSPAPAGATPETFSNGSSCEQSPREGDWSHSRTGARRVRISS